MSCPSCGLTKAEVLFLHTENQVLLVGGNCQNVVADGICGKPLGAHSASGNNYGTYFMNAYFYLNYKKERNFALLLLKKYVLSHIIPYLYLFNYAI
jgi:hypothetical protein